MQMLNVLGNPPQVDSVANSAWCTATNADDLKKAGYFARLEQTNDYLTTGADAPVIRPVSSQMM